MKSRIIIYTVILLAFVSNGCNMKYFPNDQIPSDKVKGSSEMLSNLTIGTYSRLREANYVRLRHFMMELPGDEVVWCKHSGDDLQLFYSYDRIINSNACRNFWTSAYHGIYQANSVIEAIPDDASDDLLQLKGENLFLRALMHLDLVKIFSRPYSQDPEKNLGIIIKKHTDSKDLPGRSIVKETYDFIINDLLKAASLMHVEKPDIFASKEVAWALLARAYLYTEQYNKAIDYADSVINSGRYQLVSTDKLPDYYKMTPEENPETIFAIKHIPSENFGKSGIGSLYTRDGWGEIFVSESYLKLIYKSPNDQRIKFIDPDFVYDASGNKIADNSEPCGYKVNKRSGYSKYYMLKYTGQGGTPLLASPVVIRLAEMYLIKAEALAKTNKGMEALDMVNIIRKRAGLHDSQLFSIGDLKGYSSVLDVVIAERELELGFEGHRSFDLYRNNLPEHRDFTHDEAWSGPKIIKPTDKDIIPYIPELEMQLNQRLVQNP